MIRFLTNFVFCLMLVNLTADVKAMSGGKQTGGAVNPVIAKKRGHATVKGSKLGVWEPVVKNTLIFSSDFISTAPDSWVRLEFNRGSIEIYGSSLLYVPSTKNAQGEMDITKVELINGTARFDINKGESSPFFRFETENTAGVVKGTVFVVTTDKHRTSIAVYKGKVSLQNKEHSKNRELSLSSGKVVTIMEDGSVEDIVAFNARKAFSLLCEGVKPDISGDVLKGEEDESDDDETGWDWEKKDQDSDNGGGEVDGRDGERSEGSDDKEARGSPTPGTLPTLTPTSTPNLPTPIRMPTQTPAFTLPTTSSVCVTVFEDQNGDREQNNGELALPGVEFWLTKEEQVVARIITSDAGRPACFDSFGPGIYYLHAAAPPGYRRPPS